MNDRDLALSTIQRLPEEATLEDVTDEIALLAALREGIRQANEGKTKPHDEVKALMNSWLTQ